MTVSKDVERLVRSMQRQRVAPEYIQHYLAETYQLDLKTITELFERLGIGGPKGGGGHGGGHGGAPGGLANRPGTGKPGEGGVKKQSFY